MSNFSLITSRKRGVTAIEEVGEELLEDADGETLEEEATVGLEGIELMDHQIAFILKYFSTLEQLKMNLFGINRTFI